MKEQKEALLLELETKVQKAAEAIARNHQYIKFAQEYITDYNGSRAARAAGYETKTAYSQASRLLKNVEVMTYINALIAVHRYKTGITKESIIKTLTSIKESDIRNYLRQNKKGQVEMIPMDEWTDSMAEAVEGIKMGKYGIELKLQGKSWAIEMLNKHLGLYEADNSQLGKGVAEAVGILLPDNKRGKVVPNLSENQE